MAPKRVAKSPARQSPAGKSPAKSTPPAKVKPPPKPPPSKFRKRAGYAALFLAILLGLMLRIPTYGWIFWMAPDNMGSTAPEYVARAIPAIEDLSDKAAMQRALSSSRPAFIRFDSRGCTGCANLDRTYAALPLTIPGATAWRVDCGSVAHSLCEAPAVAERVPPGGLAFAHARQGTFEWYEGRRVASALWSWAERVAGIADDGRAMHRAFDRIYLLDQWVANGGPGSGTGSAPEVNAEYMTFLEGLIRERGVRTIVEVGSGDFELMRHVDLQGANFHGYDVSADAVRRARLAAVDDRRDVWFSVSEPAQQYEPADLLIVKDVLQHLPLADARHIIDQLPRFRLAVLVNDGVPRMPNLDVSHDGSEMRAGLYRSIDVTMPPFKLSCEKELKLHEGAGLSIIPGAVKVTCLYAARDTTPASVP